MNRTNATVNTSNAVLYADATFAATNMPLVNGTNTFTAIGQDSYGHVSTNMSICYLPTTNSFSYDLNGNLLSDTNRNFSYDDENQLTSVWVTNIWREDFVYDGKFRRRIEKDSAWESGAWVQTNETHFIYDGDVVIQERDVNSNPLVTYTRSGSMLLARTDYGQEIPGSPTTAFYHLDANANVMMLIYANQIVAAKYQYGPFGETLSLSGPLAPFNTPRFASKEWNDRAGIYYFGRRYYDPILIRFLNHDPIGEDGGINLYAYCGNNPINLIDPIGLWPCWLDNLLNSLLGPDPLANDPTLHDPLFDTTVPSDVSDPDWFDHLLDFTILYQQIKAQQDAQQLANMTPFQRELDQQLQFVAAMYGGEVAAPEMLFAGNTTRFISTENGLVDVQPTLGRINSGGSFPHANDGGIFQNRPIPGNTIPELPVQPYGYYNEYVVPTPGVNDAGLMRIVTGQSGELYFTPNHYQTFINLNP